MEFNIRKAYETKLNVRPVMITMYHEYVFEGPCRFTSGEKLKKEYELKANAEYYAQMDEAFKSAIGSEDVNLLDSIHIQIDESFVTQDEDLIRMAENSDEVDLYLIATTAIGDMVMEFAQRYKKPIIILGGCINTTYSAGLLARGCEVYPCETLEDAVDFMKVLKTKKALAETKVLSLVRLNSNNAPGITDSFISLDEVTQKFGTRFRNYNIHEFMDQLHKREPGTNPTLPGRIESNITDEDEEAIAVLTDEFIGNADKNYMKREDVLCSMKAHYLVNKLMARLDCNAFTSPCFDVCATRRFNEEKFTFCLNHSLNNEKGIISACEYDMCSVLSMVVLSCFAKSAPYMGNCVPNPIKSNLIQLLSKMMFNQETVDTIIEELKDTENLVLTFHAVPNRKLRGFNSSMEPYSIRSFTGSGWGSTIRYDFAKDKGQKITMCRFDPSCKKILVARGTIVGGIGYNDINCSEGVFFTVEDSKDLFQKVSRFGNHQPLVYGDYFDYIVKLGMVLGLEVITA